MRALLLGSLVAIVASAAECNIPVELVIVHDVTAFAVAELDGVVLDPPESLNGYVQKTGAVLKSIMDELEQTNPNSKVGLITFKDKPIEDMGEEGDYCARVDWPLVGIDQIESVATTLKQTLHLGGGIAPDSNYYGLLYSAIHPEVGWTEPLFDEATGKFERARVVIHLTNTNAYGQSWDPSICKDPAVCPTITHTNSYWPDEEEDCLTRTYPNTATLIDQLVEKNINVATILIQPGVTAADQVRAADLWTWWMGELHKQQYRIETQCNPDDFYPLDPRTTCNPDFVPAADLDFRLQILPLYLPNTLTEVDEPEEKLREAIRTIVSGFAGEVCAANGNGDSDGDGGSEGDGNGDGQDGPDSTDPDSDGGNSGGSDGDVDDDTTPEEGNSDGNSDEDGTSDEDGNNNGGSTTSSSTPQTVTSIIEEGAPVGLIVGVTVGGAAAVGLIAGAVTKWGMRPASNPRFEELESN